MGGLLYLLKVRPSKNAPLRAIPATDLSKWPGATVLLKPTSLKRVPSEASHSTRINTTHRFTDAPSADAPPCLQCAEIPILITHHPANLRNRGTLKQLLTLSSQQIVGYFYVR